VRPIPKTSFPKEVRGRVEAVNKAIRAYSRPGHGVNHEYQLRTHGRWLPLAVDLVRAFEDLYTACGWKFKWSKYLVKAAKDAGMI